MKKTLLSFVAFLLATTMLLGAFASCDDSGSVPDESSSQTETEKIDTESSVSDESETTSGSNTLVESDTESDVEESETVDIEVPTPSIEGIENALIIQNAHDLKNGVNAYFTDGKRSDFALENQNMNLEYALAAYKDQLITSLTNKEGKTYIENTGDVFVRMKNGNTFYASDSSKAATANLYRLGYYMYESRFEEQLFSGGIIENSTLNMDIVGLGRQQVKVSQNEDGSQHVIVIKSTDPFLKLKNVSYTAEDYNYIKITMRASTTKMTSCAFYVWTEGKDHQTAYFSVYPDGEYHTYYVDLSRLSNYSGKVTQLRLDFESNVKENDTYDISEIALVNGSDGGAPTELGLNRSFFIYSDKLHQVIQIATNKVPTTDIDMIGVETKIAADTVDKLIVKDSSGTHTSLDDVDWSRAEYVGFDIKNAGIFGYILPVDGRGDRLEVTLDDGVYTVIQSRAPENGTINPSAYYDSEKGRYIALEGCEGVNSNANDFFMGHRIYTDTNHSFEEFIHEAENERNPLSAEHFVISTKESSYIATYTCPACGYVSDENMLVCKSCSETVTFTVNANMYYIGYEPLRGIYQFYIPEESFSGPFFSYPNKHINLTFQITGDDVDRSIYLMSLGTKNGQLECAALLDENKMLLPVPLEVGKNFSEGSGERNLWNVEDHVYSETVFPMVIKAGSKDKYTLLNLYQNWGQYPLKQVSWIQFYAPYYHLSTGVTETNCIVPYYSCKNARGLGTLPDHRAMSAPLWAGQPQHTSGGSHRWLIYTDKNGVYSASENTRDTIDSYGPVYADVYMDFLSDDGNIKVSYTHTEFPQTDENRAFYEMKYEILGDVSFADFARDFGFYDVSDNDAKGDYINVGYLNEKNESVIVDAAKGEESNKYVLGDKCPYFSFFNMPDWDRESTSAEGYVNLSFLVYDYEIVIDGQKTDTHLAIVNENNRVRLTLDLGEVTLKAGDSFTINAIVMPWGSQETVYDSDEIAGDQNVRDVRTNTLLNPLTPYALENCETMESVFVPKLRSTNGKDATFTLKGGQNNVAVRVYGFRKLTVPKIQELVDGEWVDYNVSSAYAPDRFGNGFYYDGYSVHYDGDGTFSYAFIVPMDYTDADGRTFRVRADEDFDRWPRELPKIETEEFELPLDLYLDANALYTGMKNHLGKNVEKVVLSADASYTGVFSNGSLEAYFDAFAGDGGKTTTGQYFVVKYRIPETNPNPYPYLEIFTSTTDMTKAGRSFQLGTGFINDGKWHTLVVDLAAWNRDTFKPDENGDYRAQYLRLDVFNEKYPQGNSIDFAYVGMHHDLNEIFALNEDLNEILVVTEKNKLTTYDAKGNVISNPSEEKPQDPTEGFNIYYPSSELAQKAINSGGGHSGKTVTSADGKYVTIFHDTDTERARIESYFNVFKGNEQVTGQYLVLRYRASKRCGELEFYCSTESSGAASGQNFGLNAANRMFQTDGEWHNAVIDLSKVLPDTFKPNANGEYVAKYLRMDLFNFDQPSTNEYYVDIAYIGMTSSYEDAIGHAENSFFYDGSAAINATTGKALESESGESGSATTSTPDYLTYYDATALISAANAPGNGHLGAEELIENGACARFHLCTDQSKTEAVRRESYFSLLKDNADLTGQYLVIKYRAPEQVGSLQVYASTENKGASDNGGSTSITKEKNLFLGDNEWHVVVLDLSHCIRTYTPSSGKYYAKHLRIDLFNFDKVPEAGTETYVDLAYIGTTDDYTKILGKDASVANLIVYDGAATTVVPNVKK